MTTIDTHRPVALRAREGLRADPAAQAFALLRTAFTVAPIAFGLDKFFDVVVEWERYLAPELVDALPGSATQLMYLVGAIEIVAGLVVAVRPRFGGYLVAGWLAGIIANLLVLGEHHDIALRDVGLLVGAVALARLAAVPAHRTDHRSAGS